MSDTAWLMRLFVDAGISIVPVRCDGSKAPHLQKWADLQQRLPSVGEIESWSGLGFGAIGGRISGGLEIMDFDEDAEIIFPQWYRAVERIACRLPTIETPSFGWHVYYRCCEYGGNSKIAKSADSKQTYIETRGDGGYVVAPGSPLRVHPTRRPYIQVSGPPLPDVPTIAREDRTRLFEAARSFDRRGEEHRERIRRKKTGTAAVASNDKHPVVAAFNTSADWESILCPAGWQTRDGEIWTRPGKTYGTSARIVNAKDGSEVLTVFSANAGPLTPDGGYRSFSKFAAWAALNYGGNWKQAVRAVAEALHL